MRTTVDLNDELLRAAKHRAARENLTLRQVFETALRAHLGPQGPGRAFTLRWRTEEGRLQPGVRLDDRDALFDLMEERR